MVKVASLINLTSCRGSSFVISIRGCHWPISSSLATPAPARLRPLMRTLKSDDARKHAPSARYTAMHLHHLYIGSEGLVRTFCLHTLKQFLARGNESHASSEPPGGDSARTAQDQPAGALSTNADSLRSSTRGSLSVTVGFNINIKALLLSISTVAAVNKGCIRY